MAERLDAYNFPRGGRMSPYDWDSWLDGSPWKLVAGVDFQCKPSSIRGLAGQQARDRGLSLRAHVDEDGIVIQAFPRSDDVAE